MDSILQINPHLHFLTDSLEFSEVLFDPSNLTLTTLSKYFVYIFIRITKRRDIHHLLIGATVPGF